MKKIRIYLFVVFCYLFVFIGVTKGEVKNGFLVRGALYLDWMGIQAEDTDFYSLLSSRLKLTLLNNPGHGWTISIDMRDRFNPGEGGGNRLIIYDARLSYDRLNKKLFFHLGQMNLYDTAGIGELTGGVVGYKINKYLSLGGYAGLEPDIYAGKWDTDYNKYGFFLRYRGTGARQFSLSFNRVGFNNQTERQFLYSSLLFPVKRIVVLYGNVEYELANGIKTEDRLSRLFLNGRIDLSKYVDVTANYSSGRGLDYHQFILEQSQNPTIQNSEVERYYYNETYGIRLSVKPVKSMRIFVAKRESERKDKGIKNHTTWFGLSLSNLFKTGISLFGNYNINRGDASESDSYYISLSRNFGKLSCSLSFADYYNGVRFTGEGTPEVFHLPDRQTVSANVFVVFSRIFSLSLDYAYSYQKENVEHQFFVRVIFRKR